MTDYGTIKLPREAYETHNERRQEMGLTWEDYINGQAPEVSNGSEDIIKKLDRIEAAAKEATNAAQSADKQLEDLHR